MSDKNEVLLNAMPSSDLPKFNNPPVVETVLGVQFEPLPHFGNAHLGAFWQQLEGDWLNVSDVPPLEPQFERFGDQMAWRAAGLHLKLSQDPNTRLQIRNSTNDRMVQVQNGRLHYNWLGHGGKPYPSYETVKPEFDWALDVFKQFLAKQELGELQPNQWEITYVNRIPKGTVWQEPEEWVSLFPSLTPLSAHGVSVQLESFDGEWHYEIKPQQGRLHVNLSHGSRKEGEEELLTLNLTARGPISASDGPTLDEGLSLGHETIVRTFKDLTSPDAHDYWGLIHD